MSQGRHINFWDLTKKSCWALLCGAFYAFTVHWIAGEEYVVREEAKIYAPFAGMNYPGVHRKQSTVLLIDDAALTRAGQSWPAQYSYDARLLKAIGNYEPRAIFLDLYFAAQRADPTLPRLLEQLCELKNKNVKIYLGATKGGGDTFILRPEIEALAGKCFEKVALTYTPDSVDRLAWTYPIEESNSKEGNGRPVRSAALALYEDVVGKKLERDGYPLALTWGLEPAKDGIGWGLKNGKETREAYCRESHGVLEYLPKGARQWKYKDAMKPVCVYQETLYVRELSPSSEMEEQHVKERIKGRTIFLGTALPDSADIVLSPIHGRIPGVYLHAMAFDNLLSFGENYPKNVEFDWPTDWTRWKVVLFVLAALSVVTILPKLIYAVAVVKLGPKPWIFPGVQQALSEIVTPVLGARRRHMLFLAVQGAIKIVLSVMVGCLLFYAGQRWASIGILSVVGIVFFTVAGEWTEINEKLSKYIFEKKETRSEDVSSTVIDKGPSHVK